MSTCEASGTASRSCLSHARFALQTRLDSSLVLAAPTLTVTPVLNFTSNLPYPSLHTKSRVWQLQILGKRQSNTNGNNAPKRGARCGRATVTVAPKCFETADTARTFD